MNQSYIRDQYEREGYVRINGMYKDSELEEVHEVLSRFHENWLKDNAGFYQERAINSAYITGTKYLDEDDRRTLFRFIGSSKLAGVFQTVLPGEAMFVGSQLFFDPANPGKKNYWHRDIQYNENTEEEQQASLQKINPLHLRIAMKPERGVELVPGTHRRWDTGEEYDVRMQRNSRQVHDDLSTGCTVELERGDLLLFSAAMIHRGLYGGHRFALDLLFGSADVTFAQFVDDDCLPGPEHLAAIECPGPFEVTRTLK